MNETKLSEKVPYQLGLPPMELAEPKLNDRKNDSTRRCTYPLIQKILAVITIISVMVGAYILLVSMAKGTDCYYCSTAEIVIVNEESPNVTISQGNVEIYVQFKNRTEPENKERDKRDLSAQYENNANDFIDKLDDEKIRQARELVMKHNFECNDNNQGEICKHFVTTIRSLVENKDADDESDIVFAEASKRSELIMSTEKAKRETEPLENQRIQSTPNLPFVARDNYGYIPAPIQAPVLPYQPPAAPSIVDTCLLAKLLKQKLPHALHDISALAPSPYESHPIPYSRFAQDVVPTPHFHAREATAPRPTMHPQDVAIIMNLLNNRPTERSSNSSKRDVECTPGSIPCANSGGCVLENQWCDGHVDCPDVSDESQCSCKSRVDKARLCDGYFDCPFGEDEMGCYGCSDSTFSCMDLDINSQSTCFLNDQRCNNVMDCPNRRDELDCTMLTPTLHKSALFAVSNTEGFLHRNFKGDWYAVCENPYLWAHEACRKETGLILRPPFIQVLPIDPMIKVNYLNTGQGGLIHMSHTCFNNSAMYVTCPDLLCGTRIMPTTQILRENAEAENHLFGRNKRFLLQNRPFSYWFRNRVKRHVGNLTAGFNPIPLDNVSLRDKRIESRVVGGRPSMPADWPWMIAMYRNGMFHCGGVILTQQWVMSAAHCVHKFWDHYFEIRVGMLRRFSFSPQEHNHKVTHVIVNQFYNQADMRNDLSLLKVEPAIQFSRWVRPICLPGPETAGTDWFWGPPPGTICTAVGWGATVEHGPDPDHLREVEVPVWKNCKHREDKEGKEICAGLSEGGRDACQGDSGGPLLCKNPLNPQQWYMAGITSHGDGCGRKNEPGVYTRVSLFVKWIRYHIFSHSLPTLQPKQECPGFKCISGMLKCLPSKRVCDKIIDCLGGEDELNCDSMKFEQKSDNLFLSSPRYITRGLQKVVQTKEAETENTSKNKRNGESPVEIEKYFREYLSNLTKDPQHTYDGLTDTDDILTNGPSLPIETSIDEIEKRFREYLLNLAARPQSASIASQGKSNSDTDFTKATLKTTDQSTNTNDIFKTRDSDAFETFTSTNTERTEREMSVDETTTTNDMFGGRDSDTVEPFTSANTKDIVKINRGDLVDSISITLPKNSLETMSHFIDKSNRREADIHEHWDDEIITSDPLLTNSVDGSNISETITPVTSKQNEPKNEHIESTTTTHFNNEIETSTAFTMQAEPETKDINKDVQESETTINTEKPELHTNSNTKTSAEVVTEKSESHTTLNSQMNTEVNTEEPESKDLLINLPDSQESSNSNTINNISVTNKIQDVFTSILAPARVKKQLKLPKEFECRHIKQIVPYNQRCDRKADCEDGTDELSCSCIDYLTRFDHHLLCDGIFDCLDGLDEMNCYSCPEDHFLCKRSQLCLPSKYVCDDRPHCPMGEDEIDCFALTNGQSIDIDIDGKPKVSLEGFLTKKYNKDWHVVCDENLATDQQEMLSSHICRYLGFSSANRYLVKHIKIKEEIHRSSSMDDVRNRRNIENTVPVHFAYRKSEDSARSIVIKEPQFLKEECIPNINRTCMSLYVYCEQALFSDNFDITNEILYKRDASEEKHMWPWVAKVFVDGDYRCTGVLVDLSWVLVSHSCLWDTLLSHHHLAVVLGSHRTFTSHKGMYEQIIKVDAKKDLYHTKGVLLHLKEAAQLTSMVKPMAVSSHIEDEQPKVCVAIGQDETNTTVGIFLEETNENCNLHNRCFRRTSKENICAPGSISRQHWAGIISCHSERGWYPSASFVDNRGECGITSFIVGSDVGNLKNEIKNFVGRKVPDSTEASSALDCEGIRCGRGKCIKLAQVCDGVPDCEDRIDEQDEACQMKMNTCTKEPYHRGCDCSTGEMKCHNGRCVAKELFGDGRDDCGDGTDEPAQMSCSHYLARVKPSRLCDGVLHCKDRSDEDPMFCKCFAKQGYRCNKAPSDVDLCVAHDVVCDGVKDCPNGEDEQTCLALSAPEGTTYGTGQVMHRSFGVWHTKCYRTENHTKSELEAICRELGFISGHAKQLKPPPNLSRPSKFVLDEFSEVTLNNNTSIMIRNTNDPLAKAVVDGSMEDCYPVYIECL